MIIFHDYICDAGLFFMAYAYLKTTWGCEIIWLLTQQMLKNPWYFSIVSKK